MSLTTRRVYGKAVSAGMSGSEGTLGERSVANFAAAGTAHEAHFADAERREIVVQHEALGGLAGLQQFDALGVVLGAQREGHQGLGFAAGEQRRAVGSRQHAGFDGDLADLIEGAAIRTAVVLQHFVAEDALLEGLEDLLAFVFLLVREAFEDLLFHVGDAAVALQLGVLFGVQRVDEGFAGLGGDLIVERLVEGLGFENTLGLSDFHHQFVEWRRRSFCSSCGRNRWRR